MNNLKIMATTAKQKLKLLIAFISSGFLLCLLQSCVSTGNISNINQNPSSNSNSNQIAADDNVKLGLAYLQEGNTPRAKEKLLQAENQAPRWPVAKDALGYFFETTGDKKEAEKYYQQAILLLPNDGASLNNYGAFLCRDH